ncbi:MAG: IS630 family transposase [Deltaproteobacteria bacterium]|nr:IS630 family transposase [Deltaproteobacteria bacterium]
MPKKAMNINCRNEQRTELERLASSRTLESRLVDRAKIILLSLDGLQNKDIAKRFSIRSNTVTDIRKRFNENGIQGLYDKPRSGKPKTYDKNFRNKVLKLLETEPPSGHASWDGPLIAERLKTSTHAVWRLLHKEGIQLSRKRSWCISTDPQFVAKSADIIGLYLNPPLNAVVISVDEKPSIQALERQTGYVKVKNGKIVQAYKSTYKRCGTVNLFAALEIATGKVFGKITKEKKRPDFLGFMDEIMADLPNDKEVHVILDNYSTHKKNEEWLQEHPNVYFHFTPTSASWLNQIEIWFGIFSRKVLRGAGFENIAKLKDAIESYIKYYNKSPKPFVWRKREVKGSQLKNTIVNLSD